MGTHLGQLASPVHSLPPLRDGASTEDSLRDFLSAADSFLVEMGSLFTSLERLDNGSDSESMYSIRTVSSVSLDSTIESVESVESEDHGDASDAWSLQVQEGNDDDDKNNDGGSSSTDSSDSVTTTYRSVRPERQTLWLPECLQGSSDEASTYSNWDMTSVGLYLMYGDIEDSCPTWPSSASTSDHSSAPSPLFVCSSEFESEEFQSPQTFAITATAHGSPTGFSEVKLSKSLEGSVRVSAEAGEDDEDDIFIALLKADYRIHDSAAGEREKRSFVHFLEYYFGIGVDAEGTIYACSASGNNEEETPRASLVIDHSALRAKITTWLDCDLSRIVELYQDSPDGEDISLEGTELLSRSNSCNVSCCTHSTTLTERKISQKYSPSIKRKVSVQSSTSFQGDFSLTTSSSIQRTISLSSTGPIKRKSPVLSPGPIQRTAALSPSASLQHKMSISCSTPLRR
jgi:hypothetical protein